MSTPNSNDIAEESVDDIDGNSDNKQLSNEAQNNPELTEYQQVLDKLQELLVKVEDRTDQLSAKEQEAEQQQINDLFAQAQEKLNDNIHNVNYQDQDYQQSLIELAAYFGNIDTITILLGEKHLETLKQKPYQLGWAIRNAAYHGHDEALELLLEAPDVRDAVIEKCSIKLGWAIRYAARNGHHKALNLLLDKPEVLKKVIDNCPYHLGRAIYSAAKNGQHQSLKYLLDNPAALKTVIENFPDKLGEAIDAAAYNGHDQALEHLLNNPNVLKTVIENSPDKLGEAIDAAAYNGHDEALELLLEAPGVRDAVIEKCPKQLGSAIYYAAFWNHDKSLELLVTKNILEKLQKQSPKTLQEIEKNLNEREKAQHITPAVQKVVTEGLKNIKELKNRKTVKTALVAGGVVAGGAASVVGGTFVGALLAKKGLNLVKDTRLVTNHLLPAFNKVNDQLMKISSKLDLNKLAKAFTDPKIAALMIGMAAILGVISSIVAGVGAHKKQGGTILGR
jgi:ankyrin repeat protein